MTTSEVLRRAYPTQDRYQPWQCRNVRRALHRHATPIGRLPTHPRPTIWVANAELARQIKGNRG